MSHNVYLLSHYIIMWTNFPTFYAIFTPLCILHVSRIIWIKFLLLIVATAAKFGILFILN